MADVEIRELVVRVPDVTRLQASAMVAEVVRRVADSLPDWLDAEVPTLAALRVQVQRGASIDDIARQVADAITEMLR
jgi:hypothetical protein